jgi:hypothetical protein
VNRLRRALPWLTASLAIVAVLLGAGAYSLAASTADSMPAQRQAFSTGVVPGVFPVADHAASWAAGVSPEEQSTFMFHSRAAAEKAGVIYKSSAWQPTAGEEAASLTAWKACLPSRDGRFQVAHSYQLYLTPSDCGAWWSGTLRGEQLTRLFSDW